MREEAEEQKALALVYCDAGCRDHDGHSLDRGDDNHPCGDNRSVREEGNIEEADNTGEADNTEEGDMGSRTLDRCRHNQCCTLNYSHHLLMDSLLSSTKKKYRLP